MDSHKTNLIMKRNFVKKNHLQISKQISYFQHRTLEVFIVLRRKHNVLRTANSRTANKISYFAI